MLHYEARRVGRKFIIMGIGALLLLLMVVFVAIASSMSAHSGEQFSPDGFQRRRFSYLEVFGMRLTDTTYFNNTGNLELDLAKKKWITSSGKTPKDGQWVMVSLSTPGSTYESDAAILIDYLEMSNATGAIDLDRWGQANPGYAAIMWPEIQRAAQGNMYILVPDILHHMLDLSRQKNNPLPQDLLAQKDDKPAALPDDLTKEEKAAGEARQKKIGQQSLEPFLAELYLTAGKAAQDADQTSRARFCYKQVLRLAPDTPEAQQLLDKMPVDAASETSEEEASDDEETSEDESKK